MILKTERLIIQEFTTDDSQFIYDLLNDPDWIRFVGDRNIKNLEDAKNYLAKKLIPNYKKYGFGFYKVCLPDGLVIGTAGLVDREGLEHIDIGYAFLPIGRGKGYAFEATKAIFDHAKHTLKIDPIVAIVNKKNEKSQNLLKKLGMRFEKYVTLPNDNDELCLFTTNLT